jgi:hypothetical protein
MSSAVPAVEGGTAMDAGRFLVLRISEGGGQFVSLGIDLLVT